MSLVVARLKADPLVSFGVMISSTVEDLTQEREAADRAILGLHLARFRAETFGSVSHSPQVICALLAEQCNIFILIIGERYGSVIKSKDISVVEFEYCVAHEQNPGKILVYVKDGINREPRLEEFLKRVQDFEHGYFTSSFNTPEELYESIQHDVARWLTSHVKPNNQRNRGPSHRNTLAKRVATYKRQDSPQKGTKTTNHKGGLRTTRKSA